MNNEILGKYIHVKYQTILDKKAFADKNSIEKA